MYKFLEYGDAYTILDFISKADIYNEEMFLFAPDIGILKTDELEIRNSLFTYFMQVLVEIDEKQHIKNILLCQTNQKQRDNNVARIELLSISDQNFVNYALEKMCGLLTMQEIKKVKVSILRRQLNDLVFSIMSLLGFELESTYKAWDDNLDMIVLSKIL